MKPHLYIPGATRNRMSAPEAPGQRHQQAVKIAASLAGQGLSFEAIFAQLRALYPADMRDNELAGIARWATRKGFTPCSPSREMGTIVPKPRPAAVKLAADAGAKMLAKYADAFGRQPTLDDFAAEFWERSDPHPLEDWRDDWRLLFAMLYEAGDRIGIKSTVAGSPIIKSRNDWLREKQITGTGLFVCLNPVKAGATQLRNEDIAAWRFVLLENDRATLAEQAALLAAAPLPIVAIATSGNKSLHAWLAVNAETEAAWREVAAIIFDRFEPAGFDRACGTPSRLGRLPGFIRADSNQQQRLLYINTNPPMKGILPL